MNTNIYRVKKVAIQYHSHRLSTGYRKYKHWLECRYLREYTGYINEPLLEVGCGTGRITQCLLGLGFRPTVVDDSARMLDVFKTRLGRWKLKTLHADIANLPLSNSKFGTIVSIRVIWHLSDSNIYKALKEMSRVASYSLIFDITNDQYLQSILGRAILWIFSFNKTIPNSVYLHEEEISSILKKYNFILQSRLDMESVPHVWLNLWPTQNVPYIFFYIARAIDKLTRSILPPQRRLLVYIKSK